MNRNFVIEDFDVVFHETKAKKTPKERKRQKQDTTRKQKGKKDKEEGRKERKIERDRERKSEKGGGQKRLWRKKGRHSNINKKCPF